VRCASTGAERREGGLCADPAYVVIPQAKKKKKSRGKADIEIFVEIFDFFSRHGLFVKLILWCF
jgi:hypothetical protein